MLHTDIPTPQQVDRLLNSRHRHSVSLYVPTEPASNGDAERIDFKNLVAETSSQGVAAGAKPREWEPLREQLDELYADEEFWRHQARTTAVFASPTELIVHRLPNRLSRFAAVDDRYYIKPLLRSVTFPQMAYILELSVGAARVLEVFPESAVQDVTPSDMPSDAASATGVPTISKRSHHGRIHGSEGQKVRMRQYAGQVERSLRPLLGGGDVPLILAATEPIGSIYRSMNTYPHLAPDGIDGNSETTADHDLGQAARIILDTIYAAQLAELHSVFDRRTAQRRAVNDLSQVARCATLGMVDTLLVDIDSPVRGHVGDADGALTISRDPDAVFVVDEIVRRTRSHGGTILAVRSADIPGSETVAAILRWSP
ncbi:MAG TPA: hypothetical protein VGE11_13345 [Pseudonocardia sp.]